MKLKNKVALITGGTSGLGFEIAKQLIGKGAEVIILGRSEKNVKGARTKLNSKFVSTLVCDLRKYDQIKDALKKIERLDILINCAGIIAYQPLDLHDPKNIKDIIDANLLGTIYATRELLPVFKKQNSGTILNVSSTSGLMTGGHPQQCAYIASKFGVSGFTEALKKEINDEKLNVRVLGFYPGGMNTKLFAKAGMDKDTAKFMDPVEIAEIITFMLERSESIKMDHVVVNRNKNI